MYTIRQEELFSLQELMEMAPENKYSIVFKTLDLLPALRVLNKRTHRGRPEELNYAAMVYAMLIGTIERIPTTKDLLKRLRTNEEFRRTCRFRGSDAIPSEASFSRLYTKLADSVCWELQRQVISLAAAAGFVSPSFISFDSTHVEAEERQPRKEQEVESKAESNEQPVLEMEHSPSTSAKRLEDPRKKYKRGAPTKAEAERRRLEREAWEASLPLFERKLEDMLPYTFEQLKPLIPIHPSTSSKKGSNGKLMWWHGYKLHILADSKGHYILSALFSSAHVNDGRLAIPLLKKFQTDFPDWKVKHALADAGYDVMAVYKQVRSLGAWPLIDYNERAKKPPEGLNENFHPVCQEGHSYVYDSFDAKNKSLKFTRPQECKACPLEKSGRCQRVYKIKVEKDLRRFTVPARGSKSYKKIYKKRTTVERIFAYLKGYYGLGASRKRGKRAEVDAALSVLSYTLCQYAVDCMRQKQQKQAA
ncbi:transposase [Paenibacillus mucilaginosus]|uniref:transposase n=1 Tax=Paenibacillus mucilaginosus TaxID=61624 RepID=UPI00240E6B1C|nr:transposase [Paenibacillus mucilaginosus]WFA20943.1 transposase [Paenibacillus mucilaginosus]